MEVNTREYYSFPYSLSQESTTFLFPPTSNKGKRNPSLNTFIKQKSPKSALKTQKSWPCLNGKKSVRFNSSEIRQVCMFKLEQAPLDILVSPKFNIKDSGEENEDVVSISIFYIIDKTNVPKYPLPLYVSKKQVQMLSLEIMDSLFLLGTVSVKNLAFQKHVYVRYTINKWKTFIDVEALHVSTLNDSTDTFEFEWDLDELFDGWNKDSNQQQIEFAIRYQVDNKIYWDNNDGLNYHVVVSQHEKNSYVSGIKKRENVFLLL